MNIFYLDQNPVTAAKYHCDQHVRKMIVEYAQMLSTAHHLLAKPSNLSCVTQLRENNKTPNYLSNLYKVTHENHPSSIWVRESRSNYQWLYTCMMELASIYSEATNKVHLTETKLADLLLGAPASIPSLGPTPVPLCMPDEYQSTCAVTSYRNYYQNDKSRFAKFTYNEVPRWWNGEDLPIHKTSKTRKASKAIITNSAASNGISLLAKFKIAEPVK
jgi:hypothetical protein